MIPGAGAAEAAPAFRCDMHHKRPRFRPTVIETVSIVTVDRDSAVI